MDHHASLEVLPAHAVQTGKILDLDAKIVNIRTGVIAARLSGCHLLRQGCLHSPLAVIRYHGQIPACPDLEVPARLVTDGPEVHPAPAGIDPGLTQGMAAAICVPDAIHLQHGLIALHPQQDTFLFMADAGCRPHL